MRIVIKFRGPRIHIMLSGWCGSEHHWMIRTTRTTVVKIPITDTPIDARPSFLAFTGSSTAVPLANAMHTSIQTTQYYVDWIFLFFVFGVNISAIIRYMYFGKLSTTVQPIFVEKRVINCPIVRSWQFTTYIGSVYLSLQPKLKPKTSLKPKLSCLCFGLGEVGTFCTVLLAVSSRTCLPIYIQIGSYWPTQSKRYVCTVFWETV